jgi:hypothetical protein
MLNHPSVHSQIIVSSVIGTMQRNQFPSRHSHKMGTSPQPFCPFFWWDCIWYKCIPLMIHIKPSVTALGQPLWMAAHASDWGNSLSSSRRRGKRLTMVVMFVVEFY